MIPKLDEYKKEWKFESANMIKPGLDAVKYALAKLGNPEKELKFIHVSGTNGKGSTIEYMRTILVHHNYTVGSFTSPAVYDLHDQIRINNDPATKELVNDAFGQLKNAQLDNTLTDFELLTVIALLIFQKTNPDYVLIETGMGGLLDSTNVIEPIATVITSIAIDHTQFLGNTIEDITHHKAGIIKKARPIVVGKLPKKALEIVKQTAANQHAPLFSYNKDFVIEKNSVEKFKGKEEFVWKKREMKGEHQKINIAVAIEALLQADIKLQKIIIQKAIETARLPHRFEEIKPNIFIDGAHNPAAAKELRKTIALEFPNEKVDFYIGMLKTKDVKSTIDQLIPVANSFTFLNFNHPDAASGQFLFENCTHNHKRVMALNEFKTILIQKPTKKVVISGSLYLMVDLKSFVGNK